MEWIQIESTLPDHQKTIDFACALKISQTTAVGALVRWWLWALHNRDSGFITDADGPSIAHAMDIKRSGKVILNVTQCKSGTVNMDLYATGARLKHAGVLSGEDITTEAALGKLFCLMGRTLDNARVKTLLEKDLCGEISK